MDALLSGTGVGTPSTGLLPETDLSVPVAITGQHIVPIITGSVEDAQQAQVLCNQVIGSIPQLPNDRFQVLNALLEFRHGSRVRILGTCIRSAID